jgi:CheY-like chemotaxis protein
MPGITGFEAFPRIREVVRNEQLVAAAMSGFGQEEDKQRTQAVGFDMHLTKPVFSPELDSVIAAVITRIYEGRA